MDWGSCVQGGPGGIPTLSCIPTVFQIGLTWALTFVGVVALFLLIIAGIKYITSGGGKQVEEAQKMITYAIIGLLLALFAFFIVSFIAHTTGVTCVLNFGFGNCHQ